jgi:carbamoyl-phosphate synthase large subunit
MSTERDPRRTVLVTAIGGGGVGEQILKALRMAGGYRIVGTDVRRTAAQYALVDVAVTLPLADDPEYLDAVLAVAIRLGVTAIFPGSEAELRALSGARSRFESAGLFLPIQPAGVIETCMDKVATAKFLTAEGFSPPRFTQVREREDLRAVDWFPVVLKPASGGGGSRDCFIAQSPRELELLGEYILASGAAMIAQEYVGTPDEEYTVGVLHDMDGNLINSIALHRRVEGQLHTRVRVPNRSGRAELGESLVISSGVSHGQLGAFPDVAGPCERIAAALGARGPLNVQCRLVAGEVRVFEINPRFSGTTSLRAMVGFNEPDLLMRRHVLGETVESRFSYDSALILRSLTEDVADGSPAIDWRSVQ